MKNQFLAITIAFSMGAAATAHAIPDESRNYGTVVCTQNAGYSPIQEVKYAAVLKQVGTSRMYQTQIFKKRMVPNAKWDLLYSEMLKVSTEDVMVWFNNRSNRTVVGLYLDEMNQSYLYIPGYKDSVSMNCRMSAR